MAMAGITNISMDAGAGRDLAFEPGPPVQIVDYDVAWPAMFEAIAAELVAACPPGSILSVEHVGSTSVPGLAAKPIIDLSPLVRDFDEAAALVPCLEAIGYVYRGEYGIARRHYFVYREADSRHVHILEPGNHHHLRHVLFRDYLRAHPESAAAYAAMKREMARQHGVTREAYTVAKTPFIHDILQRAGYRGPLD